MAGWFGPSGNCGCCAGEPCDTCDIPAGTYSTLRYKLEVSGFLASYDFRKEESSFGSDNWYDITASGFDALNGTYYFDLALDEDGCPKDNGTTLASESISYTWQGWNPTASDCFDATHGSGTASCQVTLTGGSNLSLNRIALVQIDHDSSTCPQTGTTVLQLRIREGTAYPAEIVWLDPDECGKIPGGSETKTFNLVVPVESNPCIGDAYEGVIGTFDMALTNQWT